MTDSMRRQTWGKVFAEKSATASVANAPFAPARRQQKLRVILCYDMNGWMHDGWMHYGWMDRWKEGRKERRKKEAKMYGPMDV